MLQSLSRKWIKFAAVTLALVAVLVPGVLCAGLSPEDLIQQVRDRERDYGGDRVGFGKSGQVIRLQLSNVLATEEAVVAAAHIPSLEDLTYACPQGATNRMTPATVRCLSALTNLHRLTLRFPLPEMSQEFVSAVASVTNLESLAIEYSKIESAESLGLLSSLTKLRKLSFAVSDDFNDECLEHLPEFPLLEDLDLSSTKVTDASLPRIEKFRNLRRLNLRGTKVTKTALDKSSLPKT